jgi:hypothetical protein
MHTGQHNYKTTKVVRMCDCVTSVSPVHDESVFKMIAIAALYPQLLHYKTSGYKKRHSTYRQRSRDLPLAEPLPLVSITLPCHTCSIRS